VAYNFYEYQKETFESTIQVLKDEIAALREERKTLLSLVERLTLK
jgi:prefoldin subunit 5